MNFFSRLKQGLSKTSSGISNSISSLFGGGKLDISTLEELEDALIMADCGLETSAAIVAELKRQKLGADATESEIRTALASVLSQHMTSAEQPLTLPEASPAVVLMVGVNGSGKTTTIGKLAAQFKTQGKSLMLAAGDTFRAGAVAQLQVWGDRNNVPVIAPEKEGADPASLIFKAYDEAKAAGVDILLCDTAGRLQNRADLMDELAKTLRVIKKQNPEAPHAVLLVLDATVGQNAHSQVEIFKDIAAVTGLVITKLDSTAKGGVAVALAEKFKLPIHFIGVGEGVDDLRPFNATDYANALVGIESQPE